MTTKKISADFFAELEGDAVPFAAAPRFVSGRCRDLSAGAGNLTIAISAVHDMVLEALRATGYEAALAERMAQMIADSVPTVQEKVQSAA